MTLVAGLVGLLSPFLVPILLVTPVVGRLPSIGNVEG
jgi:hypothetical protein